MLAGIVMDGMFGEAGAEIGPPVEIATVEVKGGVSHLDFKRREGITIPFLFLDDDGEPVDVSSADFKFYAKKNKSDASYVIEKNTTDFDLTEAAQGIAKVTLTPTDLDLDGGVYNIGVYVGEVWATFSSSSRKISQDIRMLIRPTVYG
jgi:hypothetical protein